MNVAVADSRRLLAAQRMRPGMSFLEIGCAPGLTLAHVHQTYGVSVAGMDYSEMGVQQTREMLASLNIQADLRREDVFSTSFPKDSFDVVYSSGFIEHFDDPAALVRIHLALTKPGGVALIAVPNLGGIYGRIAKYTNPEGLLMHNLLIMQPDRLRTLAPVGMCSSVTADRFGRTSLSTVSLRGKWSALRFPLKAVANMIGLLQFSEIDALCPTLVLRMTRR